MDDGLATGFTMTAALRSLRRSKPSRVVVAVPVAPPEAVEAVRAFADDVVCLEMHDDFASVGQFYEDFSPVTEEKAIEMLAPGSWRGRSASTARPGSTTTRIWASRRSRSTSTRPGPGSGSSPDAEFPASWRKSPATLSD